MPIVLCKNINIHGPNYIAPVHSTSDQDESDRVEAIWGHCCDPHPPECITQRIFKEHVSHILSVHDITYNIIK